MAELWKEGRLTGLVGLFVTNVILCDGALVDSKADIDIGCCSPVFNASLMEGSDYRCGQVAHMGNLTVRANQSKQPVRSQRLAFTFAVEETNLEDLGESLPRRCVLAFP